MVDGLSDMPQYIRCELSHTKTCLNIYMSLSYQKKALAVTSTAKPYFGMTLAIECYPMHMFNCIHISIKMHDYSLPSVFRSPSSVVISVATKGQIILVICLKGYNIWRVRAVVHTEKGE